MIEVTTPLSWNSVHRQIDYVYDFSTAFITGASANVAPPLSVLLNKIKITTSVAYPTLAVGDYIFIPSSIFLASAHYGGLRKILVVVNAAEFVLDIDYDVMHPIIFWIPFKAIIIPEITLYSGYAVGEGFDTELPLTEVARFTPEVSTDIKIRFDVSGYLKSIFRIVPPVISVPSGTVDFSLFNRFRIAFNGVTQPHYQVLNSAIESSLLVSEYFGTGKYLNENIPIVFGCGKTILTRLDVSGAVISEIIESSGDQFDYHISDYNSNDYLTS